jgi:hypothetical protein
MSGITVDVSAEGVLDAIVVAARVAGETLSAGFGQP